MTNDEALLAKAPVATAEIVAAAAVAKAGYITDYVSGQRVKATPRKSRLPRCSRVGWSN